MSRNHVIDPTFFFDAIDEFSFIYPIYVVNKNGVDEYGNTKLTYSKTTICGSLQIQTKREKQSKDGNTDEVHYKFYCKSLYRIDVGDIIEYNGNFLRCNEVLPYDEYGCREATLTMISLAAYRDFADYIKYLRGEKLI
jgi:hypothetical protein